jgi:cytochrome c oxidase accessory protein FixG
MIFSGTRKWIYPMSVTGRFQRLRRWTFLGLYVVLFLPPWIMINGHPSLQFVLADRRLFALGAIFTASDTILLLMMLLFLAFSLFFFTSLFGRLWCGYACPQTVFLDAWIRPIEQWIEGDWVRRRKRDQGPWTADKLGRKAAKWSLFLVVAFVAAMAFMSFFAGARELWTGRAGPLEYALVGIFTAGWMVDFVWFREQFCNFLCPYARFQSALTDDQSLNIMYDVERGEPRGGASARTEGRCISCNKCVVVCPQGIDIRNGFQLECIACARCVDACEDVMGRLGHDSLISYSTVASAQHRGRHAIRPRTVVYATLLTGLAAAFVFMVHSRAPFEATVNRAPGTLFTMDQDGYVRNTYILRITNNDPSVTPLPFVVTVEGIADAQVVSENVRLGSTESAAVPLVIRLRATPTMARTIPLRVRVASPAYAKVLETTFKTSGELAAVAAD